MRKSIHTITMTACPVFQEDERVNMNALGDDHVSFSASHLAASPCGEYLLVSTDGPRIVMFRIAGDDASRFCSLNDIAFNCGVPQHLEMLYVTACMQTDSGTPSQIPWTMRTMTTHAGMLQAE